MIRVPRGTGYCKTCTRRVLLTTKGRLFLHSINPKDQPRLLVRCLDSMSHSYKPGPDWRPQPPKETP